MNKEIISIIIPIITSIIAYLGARYNSKTELSKVKEQCKNDIAKVKEECSSQIQTIKAQAEADIQKLQCQLEKEAEVYEKNKQTDVIADIFKDATKDMFKDMFKSPEDCKNIMNTLSEFDKILKK